MAQRNRTTVVPGARPSRASRTLQTLRLAVAAAALLALGACGGGGGGPDKAVALGVVQLTVTDGYGATVAGATVAGPHGVSSTDAQGVTLVLTDAPGAAAQVTVSRDNFDERSLAVASTPGKVNEVVVVIDRKTSAAGGSLTSRSGVLPTLDASGQQLSFEIELVVVGGDAQPIETLTGADFVLRPCTPDPASGHFDCVRGSAAGGDRAYAPTASAPEASTLIPGGPARPYASALLLDQSGSIFVSDPTGARLFSAKAFLDGLDGQDQALLAAFAGGPDAMLPSAPLTVYGPFRDALQARSYFATIDSLASLIGGNTPLYDSIDAIRQQWLGAASMPAGSGKALVVFTDGADTSCASQEACRLRREQTILGARQDQVRLFTVGLSRGVDIAALGELANGTGGALLYADNAAQLVPLYGSVGRLMSLSLATYRLRWTVRADGPDAFRPGQALLGRVQVTAGGSSFDVPFVVGIP
jgi:hypothetical protein